MTWQEFQKQHTENNQNRREAPHVQLDDYVSAGKSLHQVELDFRRRMRTNYSNIKRMFIAMDRNLDGFVTLEDLKSVLGQFVFPMSDELFATLMAR